MTDHGEEAEVVQEAGTRSYQVQTQDGKFRRNQRALIDLPNTDTTDLIDSNETLDIVTNETNMAEASVQEQLLCRSSREKHPPNRLDLSWNS